MRLRESRVDKPRQDPAKAGAAEPKAAVASADATPPVDDQPAASSLEEAAARVAGMAKRVWLVRPGSTTEQGPATESPPPRDPPARAVVASAVEVRSASPVPAQPALQSFVSRTLTFIETRSQTSEPAASSESSHDRPPAGSRTLMLGSAATGFVLGQHRAEGRADDAGATRRGFPVPAASGGERAVVPAPGVVPAPSDGVARADMVVWRSPGVVPFSGEPADGVTPWGAPLRRSRPSVPPAKTRVETVALPSVDRRLVMIKAPASAQAASFRTMRNRLLERGDPRVVLVTSARDKEGKSVAALNLALTLAESRRFKVLLIDANARKPGLAPLLGIEPLRCFFTQLAEHAQHLEEVWSVTDVEDTGLHVLMTASKGKKPGLEGVTFPACLERLRLTYDYIVIDAPAALEGADVNLMEEAVDGILFVARRGLTRGKDLKRAMDLVAPAHVLGAFMFED